LAPRQLEVHPFSAVCDCLFNIFAATLHTGSRSSIRNLRSPHAVVTGTQVSSSARIMHYQTMHLLYSSSKHRVLSNRQYGCRFNASTNPRTLHAIACKLSLILCHEANVSLLSICIVVCSILLPNYVMKLKHIAHYTIWSNTKVLGGLQKPHNSDIC